MVHEQVKIIADFLDFVTKKMALCDVWKSVSEAEFDNACEGMEKLLMNRLYNQTFSPAIPPPDPATGRSRRRPGPPPPGRRGQHQEDVERDEILSQKIAIYSWVNEEHLDIAPLHGKGQKFLEVAQQGTPKQSHNCMTELTSIELLKISNYRAPRDKVICVLNTCKVIFGYLRHTRHDQSADSFIPLLIWTVLRANPPNLVSNVQYILRFRNANKLTGEAGYYVSSLGGAIDFIERLDRTSLTISDEEFERNVEQSVSSIAERHPPQQSVNMSHPSQGTNSLRTPTGNTPRSSLDGSRQPPRQGGKGSDDEGDSTVTAGLLRSIQRPLSTIGRMFSDDSPSPNNNSSPTSREGAVAGPPGITT